MVELVASRASRSLALPGLDRWSALMLLLRWAACHTLLRARRYGDSLDIVRVFFSFLNGCSLFRLY